MPPSFNTLADSIQLKLPEVAIFRAKGKSRHFFKTLAGQKILLTVFSCGIIVSASVD
jgi:hypothetical protein